MADYRIVIADDHPLFRGALRQALCDVYPDVRIEEAGSLDDVIAILENGDEPDLILLDLKMPGVQGFSGLMYLRAQYPGVPAVVVSANEDAPVIRRSLDFGASGFVPKSSTAEQIRAALAAVLEGEIWVPAGIDLTEDDDGEDTQMAARLATLTPQQVRVLMMLSQGLLNKQIAYELGVSEATVKAHVSAILQKMGVESRTQAVIAAGRIDGSQWQAPAPRVPHLSCSCPTRASAASRRPSCRARGRQTGRATGAVMRSTLSLSSNMSGSCGGITPRLGALPATAPAATAAPPA
jgi:DNA-binding NarL/FixJ family response regulator